MSYKISEQVAMEQLDGLMDYYDLDLNDIKNSAQRDAVESAYNRLVKAVRKGNLEFSPEATKDKNIKIVQHLKKPIGESGTIEYRELDGKAKVAMKDKSDTDYYGRIYSLLGSLSGLGETAITGLKGSDLSVAECLGVLFLQV